DPDLGGGAQLAGVALPGEAGVGADADAAGGAAGDHDRLTARRYGPRRARSSAKGRALRVYTCNWKRETANVQGPEARNSPSSSRASAALNSVRSARDSTSIRNQPSVAPKGEG